MFGIQTAGTPSHEVFLATGSHCPEFKENPIGVLIDPEELLHAYESGVPEKELMRRPKGNAERPMGARS